MSPATRYIANLRVALIYSAAGMSFFIISGPQAIIHISMDSDSTFWQIQSIIVAQLQSLSNLQMVVAIIIPDHDGRCVKTFTQHLKSARWYISKFDNKFFNKHW
jgi:hypothetical protein